MRNDMLRNIQSFRGNFATDAACEEYVINSGYGEGANGDIIPTNTVYFNTQIECFRYYNGTEWANLYQPKINVSDDEAWDIKITSSGKLLLKNTKTEQEIIHVAENQPMTPGSVLQISKLIREDTGLEQMPSGMIVKWSNIGKTSNKWLKSSSGISSIVSGEIITRDAYLIGLAVVVRKNSTFSVKLKKVDATDWLVSLNVTNNRKGILNGLEISLDAGDELQCYLSGNARYPIVTAEIIWR